MQNPDPSNLWAPPLRDGTPIAMCDTGECRLPEGYVPFGSVEHEVATYMAAHPEATENDARNFLGIAPVFTLVEFYKGNIGLDGYQFGWYKFVCWGES